MNKILSLDVLVENFPTCDFCGIEALSCIVSEANRFTYGAELPEGVALKAIQVSTPPDWNSFMVPGMKYGSLCPNCSALLRTAVEFLAKSIRDTKNRKNRYPNIL